MDSFKLQYEEIRVEIFLLSDEDVITTSKAFDGEDDDVSDWLPGK